MDFIEKVRRAWNVFTNQDQEPYSWNNGPGYSTRPDRLRFRSSNERSIIASIITRIALDVTSANFRHVQLDDDELFVEIIDSGIDRCLNVEANVDQTGKAFIHDMVASMLDEGHVAIIPVDMETNSKRSDESLAYTVRTIRTGIVTQWMPRHVRVRLYNDRTGLKEEVELPKEMVCIIENPLYAIMNEPNSTLQRLIRKINMLDLVDEQTSSGKLDVIIQLPYVVRSDLRRKQAEARRKDLEDQLKGSKYGIAYTDGTEHITQLNRPAENNLLKQIEYLMATLYAQLGMSEAVLSGTASDTEMTNYMTRTVQPIINVITSDFYRTYLTINDRTKKEAIRAFRNLFDLVPISKFAEVSEGLSRNEIVSSNELRDVLGYKTSTDPRAGELVNKNMKVKDIHSSLAQSTDLADEEIQ